MTFFKPAMLAASLLATGPALAQTAGMDHVLHSQMGGHMGGQMAPVSEPGQGAFAAIAEIVATLEADPATDWSQVNIDALRSHLVDMDLVTARSTAESTPIEGGLRFTVHGSGEVTGAVQRMVLAHAAIMDGVGDWHFAAQKTDDGAILDVTVPEADRARLAGLGFYGVMATGMHHQAHHWAMATGTNPHH
ncbi:MAG TPA: hypothetical protein ENK83_01645 [Aliiroseovarius sp.]|nr:hypothetical protein [Aliiroseovarius sp.]